MLDLPWSVTVSQAGTAAQDAQHSPIAVSKDSQVRQAVSVVDVDSNVDSIVDG